MWQVAQKPRRKFCAQKTAKKRKTHPEKPKKGKTGCVSGAGERCSRCGQVWKPENRTKMNPKSMQHMKKANRRKPSVFAGFLAGAEGLEPSARGFGVDVGELDQEQKRASVAQFSQPARKRVVLIWCYGGENRTPAGQKLPPNFAQSPPLWSQLLWLPKSASPWRKPAGKKSTGGEVKIYIRILAQALVTF